MLEMGSGHPPDRHQQSMQGKEAEDATWNKHSPRPIFHISTLEEYQENETWYHLHLTNQVSNKIFSNQANIEDKNYLLSLSVILEIQPTRLYR